MNDSGVLGALGSASPLGSSAMTELVKTKSHITDKIRRYEARMTSLKKQINETKDFKRKVQLAAEVKKTEGVISRNKAALQSTNKKIEPLKASQKKTQKTAPTKALVQVVMAGGSDAKVKSLMDQAKELEAKYDSLLTKRATLHKQADDLEKKAMTELVKTRNHITDKIRRYENHMKKARSVAEIKKAAGVVSRNKAALKITIKRLTKWKRKR